jgi:uncharacterized protein YciI
MATFIADYEPGPNWLPDRPLKDQPLKAHVDYLLRLHKDGNLLMGGPFADGSGGAVIFSATTLREVEQLLSKDPAIVDGILVASAREWLRIV